MSENLIIFIDSFPYHYLDRTQFLASFPKKVPLTPGFGFSVNIKVELFAGLTPDEVGYFCEWEYLPQSLPSWTIKSLKVLDVFRTLPKIDRALHKLVNRCFHLRENIPFAYFGYFGRGGQKSVYALDFPHPTLFSTFGLPLVLAESFPLSLGLRDKEAYRVAKERMKASDNLFVSLVDLDSLAHIYGLGSPEYDGAVAQLDEWAAELCQLFRQYHEGANLIILSDHGMAEVREKVNLQLEAHIGPSHPESYIYFLDTVMLRSWVFQPRAKERMLDYLGGLPYGRILGQEERNRFGLTSPRWGDIIFLLEEGYVFSPNFFGLRAPAAMHGYHPELASQRGMLLCEDHINTQGMEHTLDIFALLHRLLEMG